MFSYISFLIWGLFVIRSHLVNEWRSIITYAIYVYQWQAISHDKPIEVVYENMQSIEGSLFRFWEFGYKYLLPADKLEIVKPYIKKK